MGKYHDSYWPPYVSVAERRHRAAKKVAKMKKSGRDVSPVEIAGRKIASTFWGEAWCKNLEAYSDYSNRLPRGRTYVRNGSVIDLHLEAGRVRALVSGTDLYTVDINIKPLPKKKWTEIKGQCAGQIDSLVELLQGSISKGVMEIVTRKGEGLFPSPGEITLSCSCPDWATMCKHVAATLYGAGARLDHEPELLFTLRGVDPTEMVEAAIDQPTGAGKTRKGQLLATDELSSIFGVDFDMDGVSSDEASAPTRPAKRTRRVAKTRKPAASKATKKKSASKPANKKPAAVKKTAAKKKKSTVKKATAKKPAAKRAPKKAKGKPIPSPTVELAPSPIIFLLGPPGVGKSTFGSRACKELGLEFLDLAATAVAPPPDEDHLSNLPRFSRVITDRVADVVELPWPLQHERLALALARRSGVPLLLWAHPEDMQARSGHDEPLFTPVPRLKIRGGFGRNGTGCREFRRLDRACEETLLLVNLPLDEATEYVRDCIEDIREKSAASPAEREGLVGWVEDWRHDHSASPRVSKVIIDAMAGYLSHLRARGTSSRTLSGVRSDLNAAGHLVLMYNAPKGKRILEHFDGPPWEFVFRRKFSGSPTLVARYGRSLEGFARFLKESGALVDGREQAK